MLISFEQKIMAKKLDIRVDMPEHPVFTFANQDYITQVLYNLVDNAVKFSPEGASLELTVREGNRKVYISVSNEGQTIPPEELPLEVLYGALADTDAFRLVKAVSVEGKTYEELAEELGISVNACRIRVMRAKRFLQETLKTHEML